jgi:guanylate kinase
MGRYEIDYDLCARLSGLFRRCGNLYWVLGGSGAGKTTICRALSARYDIPVIDMDAHIFGDYHGRYDSERHPANTAWQRAENGLEWLLDMSWDAFDNFNRAAAVEYLDLLSDDLKASNADSEFIVDGGIWHAGILANVIPDARMVCLSNPGYSSVEVWEGTDDRSRMKEIIDRLSEPARKWKKFLEFDECIIKTLLRDCREYRIAVCVRRENDSVATTLENVATVLRLGV